MQIVENIALISINATLILQIVSFLIFLALLNRIMIRPLRTTMAQREHHLHKVSLDITSATEQFEALSRQLHQQEAAARKSAFDMRDEIEEAGKHSAAELIEQTRKEIGALRAKAQQDTAAKITDARKQLDSEADTIGNQMMAALLGRRIGS